MVDRVIKLLEGKRAGECVEIIHRADGALTYRQRMTLKNGEISVGPDCGIYDTADTAEAEARARARTLKEVLS